MAYNVERLSSVCAKSEPASYIYNETQGINVRQKFTSYALFQTLLRPLAAIPEKPLKMLQKPRNSPGF